MYCSGRAWTLVMRSMFIPVIRDVVDGCVHRSYKSSPGTISCCTWLYSNSIRFSSDLSNGPHYLQKVQNIRLKELRDSSSLGRAYWTTCTMM